MMLLEGADATEAFGCVLAGRMHCGDVVALFGDLGVGKTTLARGIARGLGFHGDVSSPTFPIVQIYEGPEMRFPLWHVDLYRVKNFAEIEELGLDDARGGAALVVEWPERLGAYLWPDTLCLYLSQSRSSGQGWPNMANESARCLTAKVPGAWENRWPPQ